MRSQRHFRVEAWLLAVFLFAASPTSAAPPRCLDSLAGASNYFSALFDRWLSSKTKSTVVSEGSDGAAEFEIFVKVGDRWRSRFEEVESAPQGNPEWIFTALGEELAAFLGFQRLGPTRLRVPTVWRIQKCIRILNEGLPDEFKILLGIYQSRKIRERPRDYLQNVADLIGLPISVRGVTRIHDFSYHLAAIFFFAPVHARLMAAHSSILLKFDDFLRERVSDPWAALVGESILLRQATHIDIGSGRLGAHLGQDRGPSALHEDIRSAINTGATAAEVLADMSFLVQNEFSFVHPRKEKEWVRLSAENKATLKALTEEFLQSRVAGAGQYQSDFLASEATHCHLLTLQREAIQRRLRQIEAQAAPMLDVRRE